MAEESKPKAYVYRFKFEDGSEKTFIVRLRPPEMSLLRSEDGPAPEWTKLECRQCPNCPLKPADSPRCPVAAGLTGIIEFFRNRQSTETVELTITTDEREFRGKKSLQHALNALIGLHMVTSGCPILDKLRPMVFTHLPFATLEETRYRVISMYLTAQFLRGRSGKEADWSAAKLNDVYSAINEVNVAFLQRLQTITPEDASLNAVAGLDCFGSFTKFTLEKNHLAQLERLFGSYLDG